MTKALTKVKKSHWCALPQRKIQHYSYFLNKTKAVSDKGFYIGSPEELSSC